MTGSDHQLSAQRLGVSYGDHQVISELDLVVPDHQVGAIIGPNGCGKSTLLRTLARLVRPSAGQVVLDGQAIHQMPTKEVARTLGLLPQSPLAPEGILVEDLVSRGRAPHRSAFTPWRTEDHAAVAEALELTHTAELAERAVDQLSGGQRQRVWIAMALAQNTDLLLLDEPTTYLDLHHQIEVLDLLTDLNRTRGTTIVMVLHDINLASRYADWLAAMNDGALIAQGTPGDVVSEQLMHDVFDLPAQVISDPVSDTPLVVPIGRHLRR